jgi:hypothetical protein
MSETNTVSPLRYTIGPDPRHFASSQAAIMVRHMCGNTRSQGGLSVIFDPVDAYWPEGFKRNSNPGPTLVSSCTGQLAQECFQNMTAPVAFGWSGCRVGLAPTGKHRLLTAHT